MSSVEDVEVEENIVTNNNTVEDNMESTETLQQETENWEESETSNWNENADRNPQFMTSMGPTSSWEGGFESQDEPTKQVQVVGKRLVQENRRIYLAKLPSTIGVEPRVFQQCNENTKQENESEFGRDTLLKMRYRRVGTKWESNTRLVKWEDGSASLFIGSECFDVTEQDISGENHLFLFRRQPSAQVAECRISHKLKIQPASISLGLQRKLGTYERFAKERKVKMAEMDRAPELEEQKLAQLEHERARAQARLEAKRRRKEQLVMENWKSAGMSREFLENDYTSNEEESDEDPSFSIANVKSRISGNRKSNGMVSEETTQEEVDESLSSKTQMERENPSRLDMLKQSDTPIGTYRSQERVESVPMLDVEHRHHKVFMLSDDEESSQEESNSDELKDSLEEQ